MRPEPGPAVPCSFDFQPRTRLVFGPGSLGRVGELARELGARRVLLVTDQGLAAAGHAGHAEAFLKAAGLHVTVFAEARENPTTADVIRCLRVAQPAGVDLIVGLGGGSAMDTAKGCNFLLTNGGRMQDYWGVGKATKPMLPLIAVPTTAGTGSECQSAALIVEEQTRQKMACLDPKAAARVALLDPSLTLSQPPRVTAMTGTDALAHAVETAVSNRRTPLSVAFSHAALKLLAPSFPTVLRAPADVEARSRMLLGAAFAGLAIENSMLGAAHAAANPLTARYGLVHGQAVGLMLPWVVRFNGQDPQVRRAYAELAAAGGIPDAGEDPDTAWEALIARLGAFLKLAGLPRSLAECGVEANAVPMLASEAARQWTAGFNPRPVTASDFAALYHAALAPH